MEQLTPPATNFRRLPSLGTAASGGGALKPFALTLTWRRLLAGLLRQAWLPGLVCLGLDVMAWLSLYGIAVRLRGDAAYGEDLPFLQVNLIGLGAVIVALYVIGGYDRRTDQCSLSYTSEHLLALSGATVLASLLIYVVASSGQALRPSRGALLVAFAAFAPASLAYRRVVSRMAAVNSARQTFLVLGSGEIARHFYESYQRSTTGQRLRFVDPRPGSERVGQRLDGPDSPVVEGDARTQLRALGPETTGVILADGLGDLPPELLDRLVRLHFQRVPVYTLESFYETHWRRVPAHAIDPVWPLQMGFHLARNSPYAQFKRVFDVLFSALACVALSPLLTLVALGTWLDSGRPVLFRQTRIGRDNRPFTMLKFRTMHARPPIPPGATLTVDELYTRAGDRRITRLGRWLRKLRLDELPQFWNVLKGDMSLIGPRAEWNLCAERYERSVPSYHLRHLVKPGITGWAQVNYPYGESDADALQKLKYDLYYIRHYSLKLDAMIILKTVHIMLFGKGQ